jgi:hypothetical protein
MNWRKFGVVIAFGITGLALLTFISFAFELGTAPLPVVLWGAGISFTVALIGAATLYGTGAIK